MGGLGWRHVVRSAGEGVWLAIAGPLPVDDREIVGRQRLGPLCMPPRGRPRSLKVLQVFVIRVDHDRVRCAFQVDPPLAEGSHYRQQLFVVDRVVQLRIAELP